MMKQHRIVTIALAALGAVTMSSCIHQVIAQQFTRDVYPGERPPHVIADVNGRPASQGWLRTDPAALPPSGNEISRIRYASDGTPYGIPSNFAGIVTSPYPPYHQLDCQGNGANDRVWDPYTRKPFLIPRIYKVN